MKACALTLIAWMVIAGPVAAMEPHAFLNKPARNTEQLVRQVKNDRVVADRYMRHFAMTQHQVAAYFRTLRPSTLAYDGDFEVFNVLPSGQIRLRTLHLKRGTPVFKDLSGKVVLKRSCGNPMTMIVTVRPEPVTQGPLDAPQITVQPVVLEAPAPETTFQPAPQLPDAIPPQTVALVPGLPELTFGELPETRREAVVPAAVAAAPSLGAFPVLILPFIFPHDKGHGGPPPVPEPSGLAACLGGLAAATCALRARRVRQRR